MASITPTERRVFAIILLLAGLLPIVMGLVGGLSFIISSSEFIGIPNGQIIPLLGPVLSSLWLAALGALDFIRPAAAAPALRPGAA